MEDCNELIADIENAIEAGNIDVSVAKNQIHVLILFQVATKSNFVWRIMLYFR